MSTMKASNQLIAASGLPNSYIDNILVTRFSDKLKYLENHENKIFLPFLLIKSTSTSKQTWGLVMKLSTLMKCPINFKRYNYLRKVANLQIYFNILP